MTGVEDVRLPVSRREIEVEKEVVINGAVLGKKRVLLVNLVVTSCDVRTLNLGSFFHYKIYEITSSVSFALEFKY